MQRVYCGLANAFALFSNPEKLKTVNITHLECGLCGLRHEARQLLNLCHECGKPLLVRYDLEQAARTLTKQSLPARRADLWRYREVLPVENDDNIVSLGEGWTPLLRANNLGE